MTLREFAELLIHGPRASRGPYGPFMGESWMTLAERDARDSRQRFARLGQVALALTALAGWYLVYQVAFRPWGL